jgi:hypothetical protein
MRCCARDELATQFIKQILQIEHGGQTRLTSRQTNEPKKTIEAIPITGTGAGRVAPKLPS